jgi:hypothetical protein
MLLLSDPPVDEPGNVIDGMLHYRLFEVSSASAWAYAAFGSSQQQLHSSGIERRHCNMQKHCRLCCKDAQGEHQWRTGKTHAVVHCSVRLATVTANDHCCCVLHADAMQEWLGAFMVWAEEVASETTSTNVIRIAAAVQRSLPQPPDLDPLEGLVPEDDGLTVVLPFSPPCYAGPLQHSSPTFEVAFVQYGNVSSDVS